MIDPPASPLPNHDSAPDRAPVPAPPSSAPGLSSDSPSPPPLQSEISNLKSDISAQDPPLDSSAAPPPPGKKPDKWAHRRGEPRLFAFLWAIYLFIATLIAFGSLGVRGVISPETYRPAARTLLLLAAIGVAVLWPMVRFSQSRPRGSPTAAAAKDLIVVLAPLQAVIWPQFFWGRWPIEVVAALSAWFGAWSLLVSGWIALVFTREHADQPRARALATAVALLAGAAGLIVTAARVGLFGADPVSHLDTALRASSAFTVVHEITSDRPWSGHAAVVSQAHWHGILVVLAVACLLWLVDLTRARSPRRAWMP